MRLSLPQLTRAARNEAKDSAKELADCLKLVEPVCRSDCPALGHRHCDSDCPEMPKSLSSDPSMPIERKIAPLVFELKATRLFEPVWSCEGHAAQGAGPARSPQIWFTAERMQHIRALAEVINELVLKGALAATWKISLTCVGNETAHTVFCLAPEGRDEFELYILHTDISVIAEHLRTGLAEFGGKLNP